MSSIFLSAINHVFLDLTIRFFFQTRYLETSIYESLQTHNCIRLFVSMVFLSFHRRLTIPVFCGLNNFTLSKPCFVVIRNMKASKLPKTIYVITLECCVSSGKLQLQITNLTAHAKSWQLNFDYTDVAANQQTHVRLHLCDSTSFVDH